MTLGPGIQIGQYQILSPLGKGGMGEVWRARDTKLGREIRSRHCRPSVAFTGLQGGDSQLLVRNADGSDAIGTLTAPEGRAEFANSWQSLHRLAASAS